MAPPHDHLGTSHAAEFQLPLYPIEPILLPIRPTRHGGGTPSAATFNRKERQPAALTLSNTRRRSVVGIAGGARKLPLTLSSGHNGSSNEGGGASCSTAGRLSEPVPFDPFTGVHCARVLMQPPQSNLSARRDSEAVSEFCGWLSERFPAVIRSLEGLQALQKRRRRRPQPVPPRPQDGKTPSDRSLLGEPSSLIEADEADGVDRGILDEEEQVGNAVRTEDQWEDDDGEGETALDGMQADRKALRDAQRDAWALLFEHARLVALAHEDEFVTQGRTRAGDVFFVLTGACDLTFRPDFLPVLLTEKDRDRRRQQQQQQCDPLDRSNPGASPSSPTRKPRTPRHESVERRRMERRLSLTCLSIEDVRRVEETALQIRSLSPGDFFGLDAALFAFAYHLVTATSRGSRQRNSLGVPVPALMHVLRVPSSVLQQMRTINHDAIGRVHQDRSSHLASVSLHSVRCSISRMMESASKPATLSPASVFPYQFDSDAVEFLRETFLFAPMSDARLRFLAAHLRPHRVRKHEFLFTTGQRVSVFLVRSGQLTLCASETVRTPTQLHNNQDSGSQSRDAGEYPGDGRAAGGSGRAAEEAKSARGRRHADNNVKHPSKPPTATMVETETRTVELEILQAHDTVGLLDACLLQDSFTRYCVATSGDARVFVVSPVALLAALAQEPASATLVADVLLRRHAWYSLRLFTSRNQYNPQREFKLSLGAQQRRSPIPCSRCGWTGHSSTSSICLRVESLRAVIANRPVVYPCETDGATSTPRPVDTVASNPDSDAIESGIDTMTLNARQRGRGRLLHSVQLAAMAVLPLHSPNEATTDRKLTAEVSSPPSAWLAYGSDTAGSSAPIAVASPGERKQQRLEQSRQRLDDALQSAGTASKKSPRATTAPSTVSRPAPGSPRSACGRPTAPAQRPGTQPSPHRLLRVARSRG